MRPLSPANLARLGLALAITSAVTAHAAAPAAKSGGGGQGPAGITGLAPIALHLGVNHIRDFSADGRAAVIVQAWRDNGNAWGHNTFMVMMVPKGDGADPARGEWNLVATEAEKPPGVAEIVRDSPHTGEDALRSVMFAHGNINGQAQTLMLIATRTMQDSVPDPAPTTIDVYQLVSNRTDAEDAVGDTADAFHRIRSWKTRIPYCSSDAALATELRIPRQNGEAPDTDNGC
ncbi:MAG: hypothetical protein PW843_02945 [Azospirillaceae bacterium]|nr:hypothetical protein [Azospirillaceae bacterium]